MQAALDIAAYTLAATMLVGVLLLGMLAFDIWFGDRFREPHPEYVRLPCTALEAARDVYGRMKSAYAAATSRERRLLEVHLRRMEERVQLLEEKVFEEQAPYYKAVARREKFWRGSKALYDQVRQMSRANRKKAHHLLEEASAAYRLASEGVKEEFERGVRRDKFMLDDLRSLGVLDETYLPKLLDQVKAHAAKYEPEAEAPVWREPGTEEADGETPRAASAGAASAPAAASPEPVLPAGDVAVTPARIGASAYAKIREALAPLFGRKSAPSQLQPVPIEVSDIPTSAWKPAPAPPRVAVAPVSPSAAASAVTVTRDVTRSSLPLPDPALLRQQDLLGEGVIAFGRSYTEPTFAVSALPRGILRQADLSHSKFNGVRFVGRHRYLDCRFAEADLKGIQLEPQARPHQFVRCDFQGAQFDASRVGFALFHECNLANTRWSGARLERVRFSDCEMDGVEWGGAEFVETRIVSMEKSKPAVAPITADHDALGPVAVTAALVPAQTIAAQVASSIPTPLSNAAAPGIESDAQPVAPPSGAR